MICGSHGEEGLDSVCKKDGMQHRDIITPNTCSNQFPVSTGVICPLESNRKQKNIHFELLLVLSSSESVILSSNEK